MLVTFTTDACADIILFGDVALTMLNAGTQRHRARCDSDNRRTCPVSPNRGEHICVR